MVVKEDFSLGRSIEAVISAVVTYCCRKHKSIEFVFFYVFKEIVNFFGARFTDIEVFRGL